MLTIADLNAQFGRQMDFNYTNIDQYNTHYLADSARNELENLYHASPSSEDGMFTGSIDRKSMEMIKLMINQKEVLNNKRWLAKAASVFVYFSKEIDNMI